MHNDINDIPAAPTPAAPRVVILIERIAPDTPPPSPALRLRNGALHLECLGARPIAEFLAEIAVAHGIMDDIVTRLDRWRDLDPATVAAVGGSRFAPILQPVPEDAA